MNKKYILIDKAEALIKNEFVKNDIFSFEVIPWIIVKVLRFKIKDYKLIKKIRIDHFDRMIEASKRYCKGESLSKIFGFIEFYGNIFKVSENVFDPRLSSEAIINFIIENGDLNKNIIDLCTGSGSIAVTISKLNKNKVDAVDISEEALQIANINNKNHKTKVNLFKMDILDDWDKYLNHKYDVIVSNPPYFTIKNIIDRKDLTKDNPLIAFYGGEDGIKFHKKIIQEAPKYLNNNGKIYLEMEEEQEIKLKKLMEINFKNISTFKDHKNIKRVIYGELKD